MDIKLKLSRSQRYNNRINALAKSGRNLLSLGLFLLLTSVIFVASEQLVYAASAQGTEDETKGLKFASDLMDSREIEPINVTGALHVIKVDVDGVNSALFTEKDRVADVLADAGVEIGEWDEVSPALDQVITQSATITVVRVEIKYEQTTSEIPYSTSQIKDSSILMGQKTLKQKGSNGVLTQTYTLKYKDGVLVSKNKSKEKISKQPVQEIIAVGTKLAVPSIYQCDFWYKEADKLTKDERERNWLKITMYRESGCNAGNIGNPPYTGLFQFHPNTFKAVGGKNIWDGHEQMRIALAIARGGGCAQWGYSGSCEIWNHGK